MWFAEAAFLAGLAAAGVPVLLHFLARGRSRRIPFPSLRFLREIDAHAARRKRIEEWVVLLLRAAAIAALCLALARPVLRGEAAKFGQATRVLVIDNSMSMDARGPGGSALERSILFARELIRRSRAADRVAVVPLHGEPLPPTENKAQAEAALDAIRPTWRGSPILPGIERALGLLADDRNPGKQVYVLSDLQASAFERIELLQTWDSWRERADLILLKPSLRAEANAAVLSAEPEPGDLLRARLRAHGGEAVVRVSLSLGGKPVAERSLRVLGEAAAAFRLPELSPGLHRIEVRSSEDVLPADNVLEAAIEISERRPVIVARDAERASSGRDPAFYVARALASGARGTRAPALLLRTRESLSAAELSKAGAVFLLEPSEVPDPLRAALEEFVRRGGGLFVSLGSGLAGEGEGRWERFFPAQLGELVAAEGAPFRIASWDKDHPIWKPLLGASPPLAPDSPAFLAYRKLALRESSRAIATFSTGDPALVVREEGEGRIAVFASALSGEWTNFPLRVIFAPWIHCALEYLSPKGLREERLAAGSRLAIRRSPASGFRSVRLEAREGEPRIAPAIAEREQLAPECLCADIGELERPGIYFLTEEYENGSALRILSVVRPEKESALEPLGAADLERILPGARFLEFSSTSEALRKCAAIAQGAELKTPLLLALLAILLLEPLLANRSALRRVAAGGRETSGAGSGGSQ